MPVSEFSDNLHGMKYRGQKEDFREAMNRQAFGLKDNDKHYHEYREIIIDQRFLAGGRIQSAIGALRKTTAFNCFVSGEIADSYVDGPGSIMARAHEAAATMRMGGGIGYDFSTLRPRGAPIKRLQSHSSGPVSFMGIFDAVCRCTSSSGHRRGAQMGVLRVDHPDIEEFVLAKQNNESLTGFNVSIAVTDEFMEAVDGNKSFDLCFKGEVYNTIDAVELWERIMRSTWDWAEPGVLFIDRINQYNNLWYCEKIAASNPCGEQPLSPFGACLLGSFNLVKYLSKQALGRYAFDYELLEHDIPIIVRAMDNVTDRTRYPLAEQRAEALTKRRMGIGITGFANASEALGSPYGSLGSLNLLEKVLTILRDGAYLASIELAKEKGAFPLFDEERYCSGRFIKTLPSEIRDQIKKHGIRNSHLTSIAPTGTISMCADNVSSSIEPVFEYVTRRVINTPDGSNELDVPDYGVEYLGVRGKTSSMITANEHVGVLTTVQRFIDSAVSKTCNVDGDIMSWDDFKGIYHNAYINGAKGCTTYNNRGKRSALLKKASAPVEESCSIDIETGRRDCA